MVIMMKLALEQWDGFKLERTQWKQGKHLNFSALVFCGTKSSTVMLYLTELSQISYDWHDKTMNDRCWWRHIYFLVANIRCGSIPTYFLGDESLSLQLSIAFVTTVPIITIKTKLPIQNLSMLYSDSNPMPFFCFTQRNFIHTNSWILCL